MTIAEPSTSRRMSPGSVAQPMSMQEHEFNFDIDDEYEVISTMALRLEELERFENEAVVVHTSTKPESDVSMLFQPVVEKPTSRSFDFFIFISFAFGSFATAIFFVGRRRKKGHPRRTNEGVTIGQDVSTSTSQISRMKTGDQTNVPELTIDVSSPNPAPFEMTTLCTSTSSGRKEFVTARKGTEENLLPETSAWESELYSMTQINHKEMSASDDSCCLVATESTLHHDAVRVMKETKILRNVLIQNGEDPSLALAWAQRRHELQLQHQRDRRKLLWESYQRHHDRQQSQSQHEELLQAVNCDPRWKANLQHARNICWNESLRLCMDATLSYHVALLMGPLVKMLKDGDFQSSRHIMSTLVELTCGCSEKATEQPIRQYEFAHLLSILGIDSLAQTGACYASCAVRVMGTFIGAFVLHYLLRIVSSPSIAHNAINLAGVLFLFPQLGEMLFDMPIRGCIFLVLSTLCVQLAVYWWYRFQYNFLSSQTNVTKQASQEVIENMENLGDMLSFTRYVTMGVTLASSILPADSTGWSIS